MPHLTLSEQMIRQHASGDVYQRGKSYVRGGAVHRPLVRGNTLEAAVEGSSYEPYRVRVTFDAGGVTAATCTCPYDWGGWCKHIVAALLAYLDAPEEVEERPTVEARLAALDAAQREALLLALARDPALTDAIEQQLDRLLFHESSRQVAQGRRTSVDVQAFRKSVRRLVHESGYGYNDYYDEGGAISLDEPLSQIRPFVEGGDSANALALLEALTDEVAEAVGDERLYAEGIEWDFLDQFWAEALLTEPLSAAERKQWEKKLLAWDGTLDDYGMGGALAGAQLAAEQGQDGAIVRAWQRGGSWEEEAEEEEEEDEALHTLAEAMLAMLGRRGEHEAYLNVARATNRGQEYLLKLVQLGRGAQAVEEAAQWLSAPDEALAVAKALREHGDFEGALRVGEQGLALKSAPSLFPGWTLPEVGEDTAHVYRYPLAAWVAELAEGMGRREVALRASEIAFRAQPSVAGYDQVKALAGERWETELHAALLGVLRERNVWGSAEAAAEIFLCEGLMADAMRVAEQSHHGPVLVRVMEAVRATHPDWVIRQALKHAEPIIEQGKASHYDDAVAWLRHARDAWRAAGRADEWQQYRATLEQKHGRKYKLMGLMKGF